MITPVLETARIILRPLKMSDAETIFRNWTSDPDVAKYMRWDTHTSVQETKDWLTAAEQNIASDTSYDWGFVLKENNMLFGSGGIYYNTAQGMFELGYNIMKKYWNLGFATEASRAVIDFAVNQLGITSFYAGHAKDNPASGKVMEKLGFVYRSDSSYTSFNGSKTFESREYTLTLPSTKHI